MNTTRSTSEKSSAIVKRDQRKDQEEDKEKAQDEPFHCREGEGGWHEDDETVSSGAEKALLERGSVTVPPPPGQGPAKGSPGLS